MVYKTTGMPSWGRLLQEKQDYLEVVREVWGMQLDATRNRIIRIDLIVAIASFALIMPTVPAAFFGMNLRSGMEVSIGISLPLSWQLHCPARAWRLQLARKLWGLRPHCRQEVSSTCARGFPCLEVTRGIEWQWWQNHVRWRARCGEEKKFLPFP